MTTTASSYTYHEGTVTFLFTDIEGSTGLLRDLGDEYADLLGVYRTILRSALQRWDGREVDTQGDAFFCTFPRATSALVAAVEAQREFNDQAWPSGASVRVRMGLHTGEPVTWEEGYVGMDVHRAARIAQLGYGGQILVSETTSALVRKDLPEGVNLSELGRFRLKDLHSPEEIAEIRIEGLPMDFPALSGELLLAPDSEELKPVHPPDFLQTDEPRVDQPRFVARERELSALQGHLEGALEGRGSVVFVVGGPGRGKTALIQEFGRRVLEHHSDLLVTSGECSTYRGEGDPYLPFRHALSVLAGDIESDWSSGVINLEDATRLWNAMPAVTQSIVESGPALVDVFVSGRELSTRLDQALGSESNWRKWFSVLERPSSITRTDLEQHSIFEQYDRVLSSISRHHPLVVLLDDLQWADSASLDLLFHLGRQIVDQRILIIGAYRPVEIVVDRDDGRHPLETIVSEFKRQYGEVEIDLSLSSEADSREFVDSFIDCEPNRLSAEFRDALYEHTGGHPLFTIELLRNLQERGDILLDSKGRWMETEHLDWSVIPARIEGVIEERIGRLPDELEDLLRVACVEGVDFSAKILARIRKLDERSVLSMVGQDLAQRHRLVQEHGIVDISGNRMYRYRFRHQLFQQHLYHALPEFERAELHREVGINLEEIYGEQSSQIASRLAFHFSEAEDRESALKYLLMAGDQARLLYAHSEAIDYYQRALQVLESKNEPEQIAHTLMKMGLVYTASFHPEEAKQAYSRAFDYWDTLDLSIRRTDIDLPLNVFRMVVAIPPELDPGRMTDDVSRFMINQLFEGLVVVDAQYNVIPAVAARWEVLDDGRCYRFHINENLHWSDGSPLTAWDFEFAWKRNLGVSPMAHLLYVIENGRAFAEKEITDPDSIGVHALDDHVLEVQLESPTAYLPFLLAHPVAAPLPRKGVASGELLGKAPEMMVCNGPYYISEYDSTSSITLQRNPYYQGRFPGNIDRIECPFLTEFGLAFEAYAAGELDAVQMIVSDLRTMIRARQLFPDDFRLVPQLSTVFLAFRVDRPPFDDQRVRKAFVHAVDRNSIVEEASQGTYLPAVGGFIPPGMPGHSRDIGLEFNPEKAKNLLGQAGYPNGKGFPGVEWLYYGREGSQREPLIPLLRKAFRDVLGLDIHPQMISWQEFLRRRDEEPADLAVSGWFADVPDPDNFLRVTFHSTEGVSPGLWKNVEFDELVEEAHHTMDPHGRIAFYKQADRLLVSDEAAIMPIMYGQGRVLAKPWVSIPQIPPALLLIKEVRIRERLVKKQESFENHKRINEEETMEQKANPNRYRVWVLVQVREIGEIAQKIYELDAGNTAPTKDDTEFMVVRVDEVLGLKGEPHNLMVVIDAASEDVFKKNLGRIEEAAGGAPIAGYVVQEHYPAATYLAHGFISDEEVDEKYPPDDVNEVGRRIFKRSPGDNPWG